MVVEDIDLWKNDVFVVGGVSVGISVKTKYPGWGKNTTGLIKI